MIENAIVYLVGHSGVGKLTVARALAARLNARVVDNHWINNPIFGLFDNDRVTPFPVGVWAQIDRVRAAVLDTIATVCPPKASFIFTHAGLDDDPAELGVFAAIQAVAERRGAVFGPVRLVCSEEELVRRVVSPERAQKLKSMNAKAASAAWRAHQVLRTGHVDELTLDTSADAAEVSAANIERHLARLCAR